MAKKSANPADAYRKAQKAKELKRNKEERKKIREDKNVKRDTRELEVEIQALKSQGNGKKLSEITQAKIKSLESELAYVNKLKEKYVAEHPDLRDKIYKSHSDRPKHVTDGEEGDDDQVDSGDVRRLYDEQGRLRDPKRSVYYDAVYNPYGVPPPGMPYLERTPEPELPQEDDDDDQGEEEIIMPSGPPPKPPSPPQSDSDSDADSDDIPLPPGPPPPKPSQPSRGPKHRPTASIPMLPPLNFASTFSAPPIPFPDPSQFHSDPSFYPNPGPSFSGYRPRPQRHIPREIQDPLSDAPTQTYQGHRAAMHELPSRPPPPSGLPPSNGAGTGASTSGDLSANRVSGSGATISAEPQLRDLRKEATAFVPRGVKRKLAHGPTVNAAPGAGVVDEEGDQVRVKDTGPSLLGKLQGVLGTRDPTEVRKGGGEEDDYQKFLDGLGDLA
ncbi:hypothetical protein M231_06710 [Tremella mesenterica]|uniref:Wbp11/ELF5/Saf1 N-terminal domain-containing protein n=1 Tax=Tremella mesenterica TaxID=5217 RepID=A0A4Q1BDF9_TREME|nr:hypothetical protein M231_06710 [Tremella mesenterica]